ncbi:MAG: (2Fe-2S)-binding protein [Bacillota bacterium]|nr:(2Fe-2S)-binding protein [Bacillota bacterium]
MIVSMFLNGKKVASEIDPGMTLLDFVRMHDCYSVKCGCETTSCGLCTVFLDDVPVLSCSVLAARADGRTVTTLEGLQEEAEEFGGFLADQGAEQCGFCNPGMVMNTIAMLRENPDPTEDEIKEYLSGNLCRCTGYESQLRAVKNYLDWKYSRGLYEGHGKEEATGGTECSEKEVR